MEAMQKGVEIHFIRATDTAGKSRQAFEHTDHFLDLKQASSFKLSLI